MIEWNNKQKVLSTSLESTPRPPIFRIFRISIPVLRAIPSSSLILAKNNERHWEGLTSGVPDGVVRANNTILWATWADLIVIENYIANDNGLLNTDEIQL